MNVLTTKTSWSGDASGAKTVTSSVGSLRLSELSTDGKTPVAVSPELPREMVSEIVQLATTIGHKLVREVQSSTALEYISCMRDIHVFHSVRPPAPAPTPTTTPPCDPETSAPKKKKRTLCSISRSLWHSLTRRRKRTGSRARVLSSARRPTQPKAPVPPSRDTPRIVGSSRVHVSLDELVEIVGHRSAHAASLLHPSMRQRSRQHTLIDTDDTYVCLRLTALRTPSLAVIDPREFLLVEYHHAFETPSGHRAYAVAHHSVHCDQRPSPSEGTVRGSLFESGLVAIESGPETVELFCVAEMDLKGHATEADNLDASQHRVVGTLTRITQTIEERTKMLLSLDHTNVFHRARRRAASHVDTCSGCDARIGKRRVGIEPYACRKCYAIVCEDCSSIWQRGQKRMRLCMECWADAELNRT